jgi:two-component system sensor histidine kinase HydH
LAAWLLCSALIGFVLGSMRDRARLIRDNENEQLISLLSTGFQEYADIGVIMESHPALKERLSGFAVYGPDLTLVYHWGKVPPVFDQGMLEHRRRSRFGRYAIPGKQGRVVFILPPNQKPTGPRLSDRSRSPHIPPRWVAPEWYMYLDIMHPGYWRMKTLTLGLFPLCSLAMLGLMGYIRHLYLRNREYRDRIEAQKNLVVLGTAASTLAHEIKNPLLSIRLQTGILRKLFPHTGQEELTIIEEEVERLSALIYRVNDYLREAQGHRIPLNSYEVLAETSQRLCGRNILVPESLTTGMILMDPHRAWSVFENILSNALEAGGPEEGITGLIQRNNGAVVIRVRDRGRGIPEEDLKRVLDPFFTRKSTGTGIGLAISKRFVEAVAGTITVENRLEGGAVVTITVPEYTPAVGALGA